MPLYTNNFGDAYAEFLREVEDIDRMCPFDGTARKPAADRAGAYFFRDTSLPFFRGMGLVVDGSYIGALKSDDAIYLELKPGSHEIEVYGLSHPDPLSSRTDTTIEVGLAHVCGL